MSIWWTSARSHIRSFKRLGTTRYYRVVTCPGESPVIIGLSLARAPFFCKMRKGNMSGPMKAICTLLRKPVRTLRRFRTEASDSDVESNSFLVDAASSSAPVEQMHLGHLSFGRTRTFQFRFFWKQGLACGCIPEGQAGGTMGYTGALLKNHKSKPIQIKHFDADPQKPATSHLVLRAWMLQRSQANDFLQGSSCRQ